MLLFSFAYSRLNPCFHWVHAIWIQAVIEKGGILPENWTYIIMFRNWKVWIYIFVTFIAMLWIVLWFFMKLHQFGEIWLFCGLVLRNLSPPLQNSLCNEKLYPLSSLLTGCFLLLNWNNWKSRSLKRILTHCMIPTFYSIAAMVTLPKLFARKRLIRNLLSRNSASMTR